MPSITAIQQTADITKVNHTQQSALVLLRAAGIKQKVKYTMLVTKPCLNRGTDKHANVHNK